MKTVCWFAAALLAATSVFAADGDPDFTFAGGSVATRAVTTPLYQLYEPGGAVGDDGSIVLAAVAGIAPHSTATRFAITKFRQDGSIDPAFGSGGVAEIDFSDGAANYPAFARAVARLDAGRWLVAGRIGPNVDLGLARLHANGQLDTAYGEAGRARLDVGGQDIVLDLQIDTQQRAWLLIDQSQRTLVRFTADGRPDATFGNNGKLSLPGDFAVLGFTLDAQGRIVLCGIQFGATVYSMAVRRLLPDGRIDTSFADDGLRLIAPDVRAGAQQVRVLPDGRILVAGNSNGGGNWTGTSKGRLTVARLTAEGQLDTGYGTNGIRVVDFIGEERSSAYPDTRMAVSADGKLTLARAVVEPVSAIRLARLLPNGQPDASFAPQGKRTLLQQAYNGLTLANVLPAAQRLVIAGTYNLGEQRVFYATALRDGDGIFRSGNE